MTTLIDAKISQGANVKIYPILGNHDYIMNPKAQIDFRSEKIKWTMPFTYKKIK